MVDSTTVQLAQRGVLTLPKKLRDEYNFKPGDTFTVIDLGGAIMLKPGRSEVQEIVEHMSARLREEGETLESLLQAAREVRDATAGL